MKIKLLTFVNILPEKKSLIFKSKTEIKAKFETINTLSNGYYCFLFYLSIF